MLRPVQDRYLPTDHEAFVAAEPPTGRVIVIAPTRAACETIEIALTLHVETYLERTNGKELRDLARTGKGFGIVAGTGTGKTLAVRPIAEEILRGPLHIGVVNREREATPELPFQNVLVVTTGIARRWFQDGDILPHDTLVVDEIHQTSAELELCLALGKRTGCRFIWLSATVDPRFYRNYLNSADVLEVYSFDPAKAADVRVMNRNPVDFLDDKFVKTILAGKRGVGVFLPTRAAVEQAAEKVSGRFPALNAAFYHGGEPIRVIRPFLEEEMDQRPFILAMTAAGQSALNVRGLDTVVIEDTRFTNLIQGGRNVLTRQHLGSNEILQMAGRVHGRIEGGRVFLLSDRPIDFARLTPTAPEFQLAGNSERVALTCADLGVRADQLDLPVPLDGVSYRRSLKELQSRGLITEDGKLSRYGKAVEALPVDRQWGELIVHAPDDLIPYLAVMSSVESLHRMTREERNIDGLIIPGSDHLTSYNLYAEAHQFAGFEGQVYGLPRHLFEAEKIAQWAEARGVLVKAIEDAALGVAGLFRAVSLPLPKMMPVADQGVYDNFAALLAEYMPFDLVIEEQTASGESARVSKSSVCSEYGAVAGTLRYFADRNGVPRAAIEGTQIPEKILRRFAKREEPELAYDANRRHTPLVMRSRTLYQGFALRSESEPVRDIPEGLLPEARRVLAEAAARGEARHPAHLRNRLALEELRRIYRKSGGKTPRMGLAELTEHYRAQLEEQNVRDLGEFFAARLDLRVDKLVPAKIRAELNALPNEVHILDRPVALEYDVEEKEGEPPVGVARLLLPEKVARMLTSRDFPKLDRELRFVVSRGSQGAVEAKSLDELQHALEGKWTPNLPPMVAPPLPERREVPGRPAKPGMKKSYRGGLPKHAGKRRRK